MLPLDFLAYVAPLLVAAHGEPLASAATQAEPGALQLRVKNTMAALALTRGGPRCGPPAGRFRLRAGFLRVR